MRRAAGRPRWILCLTALPGARAGLALELAARAVDRIEQAVEAIDDSDGHCGMLLGRARDIHLAPVRGVRPQPIRLPRDLLAPRVGGGEGTGRGGGGAY